MIVQLQRLTILDSQCSQPLEHIRHSSHAISFLREPSILKNTATGSYTNVKTNCCSACHLQENPHKSKDAIEHRELGDEFATKRTSAFA
jgi:hypothetical protein